ncbi:hypothetical protein ACJX0J_025375, partial [Zea mays]
GMDSDGFERCTRTSRGARFFFKKIITFTTAKRKKGKKIILSLLSEFLWTHTAVFFFGRQALRFRRLTGMLLVDVEHRLSLPLIFYILFIYKKIS